MNSEHPRRLSPTAERSTRDLSVLAVTSYRPEEIRNSVVGTDADVRILTLDSDVGPIARARTAVRRAGRAIRQHEPDLVLLDVYETIGAPVTWVASRYDVPIVARLVGDPWRKLTEERIEPARERRDPLEYVLNRTSHRLNRYVFERAAGFVVVSTELRHVVERRTGCAPERIGVVPVPVTTETGGSRSESAAAAQASLDVNTERVLLTVTNLKFRSKLTGVEAIVSEVRPLLRADPNLTYIVAGGGRYHSELVSALEERIDEPDVRRRIRTPGHVDDVAALYALTDVFVYVSDLDGYPNVVLEAQTAGLPVVANDAHGMRDQITDGESGFLVDPDDPGELRERVGFLLENPSVRRRLGEQARKRVQRENDPRIVSEQLEAFLTDLHNTVRSS